MSITNGIVSSKIYDKRDDFNYEIANFQFLMEMFLSSLPMVYLFLSLFVLLYCVLMLMTSTKQLILTAMLLKQGYRYHIIQKAFSKFYHSYSELIVKYNIGLKTLLQ